MERRYFLKSAAGLVLSPCLPASTVSAVVSTASVPLGAIITAPISADLMEGTLSEMFRSFTLIHGHPYDKCLQEFVWNEFGLNLLLGWDRSDKSRLMYRRDPSDIEATCYVQPKVSDIPEVVRMIWSGEIDCTFMYRCYADFSHMANYINPEIESCMFEALARLAHQVGQKRFLEKVTPQSVKDGELEIGLDFLMDKIKVTLVFDDDNYAYSMHQPVVGN